MKILKGITWGLMAFSIVAMTACQKNQTPLHDNNGEVVIGCDSGFSVDTKATAVTSVPGTLYWGASTGSAGSESAKWGCSGATVYSGSIYTGKYQTLSPTTYNYYVANQAFSVGSSTTMSVQDNSVDVVAGRVSSNSASPSVTLGHIFARTGSLTCYTQSGYSISGVSWTIRGISSVNGTAGTYNLTSGTWTSASAGLGETGISSSSDFYLIPGVYQIKVTYTLSLGEYSQTFVKYGDVTLVQGKVNNISCTAIGGNAAEVVFTTSITAWQENNRTFTWTGDRPY